MTIKNNQDIVNSTNKSLTRFSSSVTSRGLELAKKVSKFTGDNQQESSLSSESLNFEYFLNLATEQISASNYQEALFNLQQSLTLNPDCYNAYIIRSYLIYAPLGCFDEAISDYTQALRLNPKHVELLTNRGWAYYQTGNYILSLQDYDMALTIDPKYEQGYMNRGVSHMACSDYRKAIDDFQQVADINPSNSDAHNNKGLSLLYLKKYKLALDSLTKSININPENIHAYLNRGLCYIFLGKELLSAENFSCAIKINLDFTKTYLKQYGESIFSDAVLVLVNSGIAFHEKHEYLKAIEFYSYALSLEPLCEDAYYKRGIAHLQTEDFDEALSDLDQVLLINPQNTDAYISKGTIEYKKGDLNESIKEYNYAIEIDPCCELALLKRGMTKSAIGDKLGAVDDYDKIIEIDTKNYVYYFLRGKIHLELNYEFLWAEDTIKGFVLEGDEHMNSGNYIEAIECFNNALEIDGNNAEVYNRRSTSRSAIGDYEGALEDLQKAKMG